MNPYYTTSQETEYTSNPVQQPAQYYSQDADGSYVVLVPIGTCYSMGNYNNYGYVTSHNEPVPWSVPAGAGAGSGYATNEGYVTYANPVSYGGPMASVYAASEETNLATDSNLVHSPARSEEMSVSGSSLNDGEEDRLSDSGRTSASGTMTTSPAPSSGSGPSTPSSSSTAMTSPPGSPPSNVETGHSMSDVGQVVPAYGGQSQAGCRYCHQFGHWITDCPVLANMKCRFCRGTGHTRQACPVLNEMKCEKCGKAGHTRNYCGRQVLERILGKEIVSGDFESQGIVSSGGAGLVNIELELQKQQTRLDREIARKRRRRERRQRLRRERRAQQQQQRQAL